MCLTRVITAQSIITNVNKSEYVIITPAPFQLSSDWYRPSGSPVKYIIKVLIRYLASESGSILVVGDFLNRI